MRLFLLIVISVCLIQHKISAQTILYHDDFESSSSATWWNAVSNCKVVSEGTNKVLQATGYVNAVFGETSWDNYRFSCLLKASTGQMQLQFRAGNSGFYGLWMYEHSISLVRANVPSGIQTPLANANLEIDFNKWHLYKIEVYGANIKIYRDNVLYINVTDQTPLLTGQLHFIVFNSGLAFFDNLLVETDKVIPKQQADWVATGGPIDGMGYDVRIHPLNKNIMFTTDVWSGVHKSYDGGQTWHPKNSGIDTRLTPTNENRMGPSGDAIPVFCVTIDPINPDIVWCGTQNYKGLFKSTDCGETWNVKTNGLPSGLNLTFRSFTVDPTNSNIVYTGCEVTVFGQKEVTGKIFKTTNGGDNWFEVLDSKSLIRMILIDPRNTKVIYAATGIFDRCPVQEEGIWKSEDGGNTWFHANNGFSSEVMTVEGLDFVKSNPDILYATLGRFGNFRPQDFNVVNRGGIYKSTDGGKNWVRDAVRPPGIQFVPMYLTISPSDPNVIYVGLTEDAYDFWAENTILRTLDGGKSWKKFLLATDGVRAGVPISIAVHPDKPNVVYVNYYGGGVVKSTDYGETWQNSSNGYTGAQVYDIAIDTNNPEVVYSTNRTDPYKSTDTGNNWIGLAYGAAKGAAEWGAIEINQNNPNEVLLGRGMVYSLNKTTNGGMNWRYVLNIAPTKQNDYGIVTSISWSKTDSKIAFASFHFRGNDVSPTDSTAPGIYKSEDGGETWIAANNGIENTKKNVLTVQVHPHNSNIVFASVTNKGVFKSSDGGNLWVSKNNGIKNYRVKCFAFDPNNSNLVYCGIENGGLFKSTDLGENWQQITYGIDPEATIRSIVVNPKNSLEIFAHDWSTGIYWTIDGGNSWYKMNNGLTTRAGQSLAISNDGNTLYAGTEGGGVFRLIRNQASISIQSVIPDTSKLVQLALKDSLLFTMNAIDPNNRTLQYSWYMNNSLLPNQTSFKFLLKANNYQQGDYKLSLIISNSISSKTTNWQIKISSSTNIKSADEDIPISYQLYQNYPNPFNPATKIKFSLPKGSNTKLIVYDVLGREAKTLINSELNAGYHEIEFNANDLPSGIYFYRIQSNGFNSVKKMILMK